MEGLTLKSRLSDVDLPCEIPAAITEPEWIIGPSWEHKAISTQRPCMGVLPKKVRLRRNQYHSFCSYLSHSQSPYHRQNHTGHLDHQRLETRKMQSLSKHAGHMPESQGLKKSRTAAENTHSSTICTTNARQQPGFLFHTPLGNLVLISLRGPEGGGSTLPYDCASALSPTQLYLGDNH